MALNQLKAKASGPLAAMLFFVLAALTLIGCASAPETEAETQASMYKEWGIGIVSVRTTAAGNMIDFRYRVLDAEKAAMLFNRDAKPYLIHQESGKVLEVPVTAKVGPLRSSNKPQEGRIYWMFFGNKTRLVQKGDNVTVVIGDFKVENITVR